MKFLAIILFSVLSLHVSAQKSQMTGTWVGDLRDQFLQINIVEGNGRLCGYTWDYVYSNKSSHCKAFFTATYDPSSKIWNFIGTDFIEKSEDHELMRMRFILSSVKKIMVLQGYIGLKSDDIRFGTANMDYVELKKVSNKPAQIYPFMQDCIDEAKRKPAKKIAANPVTLKKNPVKKVIVPPVPTVKNSIKQNKTNPPVVKNNDNKIKQPPQVVQNNNVAAVQKMSVRKRTEAARVEINVRHIELKVYDNGTIDGDSVSIFYNKRLIVGKKRLTEKPIVIPLDLDEDTDLHEITLYAENLGSIPPNTALIIVTAGDKRYELRSSATLETNAVLVFEYKPPKN